MEATVTVQDVGTKSGQSAKGPWTLYVITGADGPTYSTFDTALGAKASTLLGKTAKITFTEEQRGEFVNNKLTGIEPADNGTAPTPTPADRPKGPVTFIADPAAEGKRISRVAIWKSMLEANPLPEGMKATNSYLAQVAYVVSYALDNIYETPKTEDESVPF